MRGAPHLLAAQPAGVLEGQANQHLHAGTPAEGVPLIRPSASTIRAVGVLFSR